jgi:hypothetical protein
MIRDTCVQWNVVIGQPKISRARVALATAPGTPPKEEHWGARGAHIYSVSVYISRCDLPDVR